MKQREHRDEETGLNTGGRVPSWSGVPTLAPRGRPRERWSCLLGAYDREMELTSGHEVGLLHGLCLNTSYPSPVRAAGKGGMIFVAKLWGEIWEGDNLVGSATMNNTQSRKEPLQLTR